nr:hypothetical protein [Tanacetum cinerariifolium]
MVAACAYDEIKKVTANWNLEDNLQQASTSGIQSNKALIYNSDGSAEVHLSENCYDNDIFNMFTQEEQYTELLEPIPKPHKVPQNDSNVIFKVSSVEQGGRTVEQHPANVEETHVLYDSLYNNLTIEVEKVKSVNLVVGLSMDVTFNGGDSGGARVAVRVRCGGVRVSLVVLSLWCDREVKS